MRISNQYQQQSTKFGSKKIPRYIYHFTSNNNYQQMLEDGFIRKEGKPNFYIDKGIYALELTNFFKFWGKNKSWGYDDLRAQILRHIVTWYPSINTDRNELVLLRIPTSKLDLQKLTVRSLNRLFGFEESQEKTFNDLYKEEREHLQGKSSAIEAPLYKGRKEAIEYIYNEDIPVKDVEQIGNIVNIPALRAEAGFSLHPIKSIMEALLAGTPELKCAELFKQFC